MFTRVIVVTTLAGIFVLANIPAAHSSSMLRQHLNIFVISDATGCPADLIKKGMALPNPDGNKPYFPQNYDVVCIDGPVKKKNVNTFQYIERVIVPKMRKEAQKTANVEELYLFVYQQPLERQFRDYIAMRFGAERASAVDGWANVSENTAFSPVLAATIYHEGRHLAIHGTWHDDAGKLLPNNRISYYPGYGLEQKEAGLLKFLNITAAILPG